MEYSWSDITAGYGSSIGTCNGVMEELAYVHLVLISPVSLATGITT